MKNIKKLFLVAVLAVLSAATAWADEAPIVTADFTAKSAKQTAYTGTWTYGNWSLTNCANNNGGWAYIRCGGKGGNSSSATKTSYTTIQGTSSINKSIKEVILLHNGKNNNNFTLNSIVLEIASDASFSNVTNTITKNPTISTSTSGSVSFTDNAPYAANSYYRITINWTVKGSSNYGLDVTKIEFYEYSSPSYTITAQSNNTSFGTVSLSGSTITATPNTGYRVSTSAPYSISPSGSATVTQNGNEFTVTPSANTTITINFEAIPSHSASFNVNGNIISQSNYLEGASISFPSNPDAISGKSFVGWSKNTISGTTDIAPTMYSSDTMGNSDVTFYAVFANETSGQIVDKTITITASDFSSLTGSYSEVSTTKTVEGNDYTITIQACKQNNKIQMRDNQTISYIYFPTLPGNIKNVSTTACYNASDASYSGTIHLKTSKTRGNTDTDDITKASLSSVNSFSIDVPGNNKSFYLLTSAGLRLSDLTVTYESTGSTTTYSDYCTTVVAATVEAPVIGIESNPFLFSTSVSMTCATDGATIYYTTNGNEPTSSSTQYNGAFTITSTTTIKAIAIKDNDESEIATVEAIKNLATPTVKISGDLTRDLNGGSDVSAGTLTAAVTYNDETVQGATVTWSSSNAEIATIDNSGAVTIKARGNVTFTATYAGNSDYAEATDTKQILFIDSDAEGGANNPYTVAQARYAIDNGGFVTEVYAIGIVSEIVNSFSSGTITFNIIDEGGSNTLQAYKCGGDEAENISIGNKVIIFGNLIKYNTTYEFASGCQIISREEISNPLIVASPASLTGFSYGEGFGPSTAKYITVSGSQLEDDIELSLGANSDFEMCLTENGQYTSSLTLTATEGSVAETPIYVRLKADKSLGYYNGTLTLSSTNAENIEVSLSGSVSGPNVNWDLSIASYESSSADIVEWSSDYASMSLSKSGSGTNANNYLGNGNDHNHTRFYKNQTLTISPKYGYAISSVEIQAISSYSDGFVGNDWTNAEKSVDGTLITITPSDGTKSVSTTISEACRATEVKVFYTIIPIAPSWSELPTPTIVTGEVYEINLAEYVTGSPAPTITVSTTVDTDWYVYEDGSLYFNSTVAGEFNFTFTATNTAGNASETLTITVVGASIVVGTNQIQAPAEGTSGTIEVTYNNIENVKPIILFYASDGETPASYDWITASINNQNNVSYVIKATEGTARTAYFKVYAKDNLGGDVYSELITVTQSAPLAPGSWILTNLADIKAGDIFVIVGTSSNVSYAMTNDNGASNAPAAENVTISGNTLTGEIADNMQWNISGNATDGYTFYPNGSTSTWLYCTNSNNGVRVGTNESNTFTVANGYLKHSGTNRYVGIYNSTDWRCYTNTDGNIAGQTFAFYKKNTDPDPTAESITLNATFNGGHYWTTYYNAAASFDLNDGAKAYTVDSNKHLRLLGDGTILPAGTAVIIISDTESITIEKRSQSSEVTVLGTNILEGSTYPVAKSVLSGTPYVLGIKNGILNFYQFTGDIIPAMKAYYTVNN